MTWRIAPEVAWVAVDDDQRVYALAMPPIRPQLLAGTLASIWLAIERGADPVASMAALYDLQPETIRGEVEAAMGELRELGLLEWVGDD